MKITSVEREFNSVQHLKKQKAEHLKDIKVTAENIHLRFF
jgi:hypothetical protein